MLTLWWEKNTGPVKKKSALNHVKVIQRILDKGTDVTKILLGML